jgi:Ca-activated chloride channel homolog
VSVEFPNMLWLLFLVIPFTVFFFLRYERNKVLLKGLIGSWRFETFSNVFLVKVFFYMLFSNLFLIFLILSLTGIKFGTRLTEEDRTGYEIVFALDISKSMMARDIYPTRLQRSASEIKTFINEMPDTRFGLVLFKGDALRVIPLTEDIHSISLVLDNLTTDLISAPGSNIEKGISAALETFQEAGRFKVIILFTDGEILDGDALSRAQYAGTQNIPVIPVGMGTAKGTKIYMDDGAMIVDKNGEPVETKINMDLLEKIAHLSHGKVYLYNEVQKIEEELFYILRNLETGEWDKNLKLEDNDIHSVFLALSLLFFIITLLIRGWRWKNVI